MADTIITNTTPGTTRGSDEGATAAIGWAVALIVILALVVGGYALYRRGGVSVPASSGAATVNVQLPSSGGTGTGTGTPAPTQ